MTVDPIYAEPGLYDDVLPEYRFHGMSDVELLETELQHLPEPEHPGRALEIGCGTGRMTHALRAATLAADHLTCIDSSATMLTAFRLQHLDLDPVQTDARTYVHEAATRTPAERFDLIAACWSLNYPLLECFERNTGTAIVQRDFDEGLRDAGAFLNDLTSVLAPGGHLLSVFFDPDSAEQAFITDIWETIAPFPGTGRDFTRRLLQDHLDNAAGTTLTAHHAGHSHARDLTQARNWFIQGHLKNFPALTTQDHVRSMIEEFLAQYVQEDGSVQVPVGVYVTTHTRT